MNLPYAEVLDGRILVHPSFAEMATLPKIPGGRWDSAHTAWSFPATRRYAELIRGRIRELATTAAFEALLHGEVAPAPAPAPVPAPAAEQPEPLPEPLIAAPPEPDIILPPGLKTIPWRHQKAAYKFALEKFAAGYHGILLAMLMGTGKTLVAIMLMLFLRATRVLIAAPLRVVPVWLTQLERHVGIHLVAVALDEAIGSVAKKRESAEQKMRLAAATGVPFIAIINYDSAWREPFASWATDKVGLWDLVIADECLPADTMIETPAGPVPVQRIRAGDTVLGFDALGNVVDAQVTRTFRRFSRQPLVQIDSLLATANHPVWVEGSGYIPADSVHPGDSIRVYENHHHHLRMVRSVVHEGNALRQGETSLLQRGVFGALANVPAGVRGEHRCEARPQHDVGTHEAESQEPGVRQTASGVPALRPESLSGPDRQREGRQSIAGPWLPHAERRKWDGADRAPEDACRPARLANGICRPDQNAAEFGVPESLQTRYCGTDIDDCGRSGWAEPSIKGPDRTGPEEGRVSGALRLEGNSGQERGCTERLRSGRVAHLVFNLETSTGNYFASGVLVHNCHRLKAPGGKASLFFKRLRPHARYRLGLSGTPLPHGLLDAYGPFGFLDVSIFGTSFSGFRQNYCLMGGYQHKQIVGFRNVEDFERRMGKITFRVGKEVLDLPEQAHITYFCELGPEARRIYRDLEEDFVARVLDGTVTAANALVKLLRLQQVAGGSLPTDDGVMHRVDTAKLRLLTDTLQDIGKDEAIIVFCRFHADLDAVHEACEANGYPSLELSGRRDQLKRWQDGEGQVLAVQISSGGVGVDLTRARFSMYYSLSFSLGEYDQSLSRVHRPGQTRPVEHIHLVARGTIDQRIMRALEKRAEVIESILAEIKH